MRLYFRFFAMHLKSRMAYKKSFFFSVVGQFLTSFSAFLALWFLLYRFENVRGYTISEVLLCFGVVLSAFALAECFFRGFDTFSATVRTAQFDRILLRPRSLIFQVLCERIEFSRLGKLLQAALMLGCGIAAAPVAWTPYRALVLAMMILGGCAVFAALFLLYAALCFFTLEGLEFMNVFTDGAREFAAYPLDVYGPALLKICTFIIPYALFQYYPLQYLLGRSSDPRLGLLPLLAPLFALPCWAVWRIGVRKYKSAGS